MIWLTRIDGNEILVNVRHVVLVELAHDAIVTLATGEKLRVVEAPDEIARRVAAWYRWTAACGWVEAEQRDE